MEIGRRSLHSNQKSVKREFESRSIVKEEQARFLKIHAENNKLWIPFLAEGSQYLTTGGESEIYLASDHKHVIKINDAVYYATWAEYFNSLVIHNLLFPGTVYELLGFPLVRMGRCVLFSNNHSLNEDRLILKILKNF